MKPRKPSRKVLRALCAETGPDDGVDPRDTIKNQAGGPKRKPARKARQLCRQVAETLDAVLACDPDDVLRNLRVREVVPAPDDGRLLVTVVDALPRDRPTDPTEVLARIARASGRWRTEVAGAITRRRAPTLVYRLALGG